MSSGLSLVTGRPYDREVTSDEQRLTCALRGMAWRDGQVVDDAVTLDELANLAHDDSRLLWVDLVNPNAADMALLAEHLDLSVQTVEDVLAPLERPKFVRASDHTFFMTYALALGDDTPDAERLALSRISGLVLPHALVTIRSDDAFDIEEVIRRWNDNSDLLARGTTGALLHGLLDTIVDGHFETVQRLDDSIEALEDIIFDGGPGDREFVRQVYGLRKDLVRLRRVILPMREVVNGVLRHGDSDPVLSRWYDDLYDHVLRVAEWTESLRDLVTSLFETNLSLQDMRLNEVMRKLAAWAAIIAVPTAVTGWFGQNIPYPGFSEPLGLILSVTIIGTGCLALWFLFRRLRWL